MKKRLLVLTLVAIVLTITLFTAYNPKKQTVQTNQKTYADYINTNVRIGVEAGDAYGIVARNVFGTNNVAEYTTTADMLVNLQMGNVDALLLSDGFSAQLKDSGQYPDLEYLVIPQEVYVNRAAPVFHTEKLRDQYNEWFEGIKADGTWQQIVNRWIGVSLPKSEDIPQFEFTGKKGTLKMCDTGTYPPLTYYNDNGKLVGFNMDMVSRFAIYMGMKIEMTTMDYHEIVPYVTSGKADMSACTIAMTDDRQSGVIFGEPSTITQAVLIVRKR